MPEPICFKIVVPSYQCPEWISKCLESLAKQGYPHVDVCVIDDASPNPRQREIISEYCDKYGWLSVFNAENQGALYNIVNGIEALEPRGDDVIFVVDGDDWLFDAHVLEKLANAYQKTDAALIYGQYIRYPEWNIGYSRPMKPDVIDQKSYRQIRWRFSNPRTFKYKLWRQVKDEDLRDSDGEYYRVAWDLAMMFPMVEMAGARFHFMNELLLVYNCDNPINDHKVHRQRQVAASERIRALPPYPTVFSGDCEHNGRRWWNRMKMQAQKIGLRMGVGVR